MRRFVCLVLVLFFAAALFAQQVSPDAYSRLKWRLIGPFRAGRVTAVGTRMACAPAAIRPSSKTLSWSCSTRERSDGRVDDGRSAPDGA